MNRFFKKILRKSARIALSLDNKCLKGKISHSIYSFLTENNYIWNKDEILTISTNELFWLQYNDPHVEAFMQRYDIPYAYKHVEEDTKSEIVVDSDYFIVEGVGAFVQALKAKKKWVDVRVHHYTEKEILKNRREIKYSDDYPNEEASLDNVLQKIMEEQAEPFLMILWSPSQHIWDDVLSGINNYMPANMKVRDYYDMTLTESELLSYMKVFYYYNTTSISAIRWKTEIFTTGMSSDAKYPIRIVTVDVRNPYYVIDQESGKPVSAFITSAKRHLRLHYKHLLSEYRFDNIFHSSDSWRESSFFKEVLNVNRDITRLLNLMNGYRGGRIAIIKRTKSHSPLHDEPILHNKLEYNTELDLLTTDDALNDVYDIVWRFANDTYKNDEVEVYEVKKEGFNNGTKYNRFIEVSCSGFVIFMFHLQTRLYSLRPEFLKESLVQARIDGIQRVVDDPVSEIYMRLAELEQHPEKQHHVEYVRHYKDILSEEGVRHAFDKKAVNKIIRIVNNIINGR